MNNTDSAASQKGEDLAKEIVDKRKTGEATNARLAVDERVLARITDGIYRQPSSAFRELVSNAYDADATFVVIQTDYPRFERIVIRDNGNGMSPESLAHMLTHIGGSSKRTRFGKDLETVNISNSNLSPAGRQLIGKIGIGLFSVAQLTQHFQVITKKRGDRYRTSADVVLKTYSEEELDDSDSKSEFITGDVTITSEESNDIDSHGTEVILMDIRRSAKEELQSLKRWDAVSGNSEGENYAVDPPRYHSGRVSLIDNGKVEIKPVFPWDVEDSPSRKFMKLYEAVGVESHGDKRSPNIEFSFDKYLSLLWSLSLQAPIGYIGKSPFDLTNKDGIRFFNLSDKSKGTAEEIVLEDGEKIGERLGLSFAKSDPIGEFNVFVDDVQLLRPIRFDSKLHGKHSISSPLMFFGKCTSRLGDYPSSYGGGALEYAVYFYWNSKIVPKENNGVLVRINNSTGILFDRNFMDYQVSEMNRLRQITSEVFIEKGLDSALNIDRESFNLSHPHYQYLMRWTHAAIRQTTNKLKLLGQEASKDAKARKAAALNSDIEKYAYTVWNKRRGDDSEFPLEFVREIDGDINLSENDEKMDLKYFGSAYLQRAVKIPDKKIRLKALAIILEAWDVFEYVKYNEQSKLVEDIFMIFDRDK